MHQIIQPKIHYYGTPVVLLSTLNEDGIANLAPMSSAWWLGQSCLLGLSTRGQTFANLHRQGEAVLNLASSDLAAAVNRLAMTTGMSPVPGYKQAIGTEYVRDKFARAGMTPLTSDLVGPPRVQEYRVGWRSASDGKRYFLQRGRDIVAQRLVDRRARHRDPA